jgi:hypothetical protein
MAAGALALAVGPGKSSGHPKFCVHSASTAANAQSQPVTEVSRCPLFPEVSVVPRGGLPQSNVIKDLEFGGTPKHPTGLLGFLSTVSHQDAACERRSDERLTSTLAVIVTPIPSGTGRYQARLDGDDRVLCVSRTPFFDAARKLVQMATMPTSHCLCATQAQTRTV